MSPNQSGRTGHKRPRWLLTFAILAMVAVLITMLMLSSGDAGPKPTTSESSVASNTLALCESGSCGLQEPIAPSRIPPAPRAKELPVSVREKPMTTPTTVEVPRGESPSRSPIELLLVQPKSPNFYDNLLADVQHWAAQSLISRNLGSAYSAPSSEDALKHLLETPTSPQWVAVVGSGSIVRKSLNLSTLIRAPVPSLGAREYDALTVSGPGNPDEAAVFLVNLRSERTKKLLQLVLEKNKTVTRGAIDLALGLQQNFDAKGGLVGDVVAAYSSSCKPMTTKRDQNTEASFQISYTKVVPIQRYLSFDCDANKRSFFRVAWAEFDAFLPNHIPSQRQMAAATVTLVSYEDTKWFRGAMLWRLVHWTSLLNFAARWGLPTLNAYTVSVLPLVMRAELPSTDATKWVAFFSASRFITTFDIPLSKHIETAEAKDKNVTVVVVDGSVLVRWDEKGVSVFNETFPLRGGNFSQAILTTARKMSAVVVDLSISAKLCDVLRRMPSRPKVKNLGVFQRWERNYVIPDEARKRLMATSGSARWVLNGNLRFTQKAVESNGLRLVDDDAGGGGGDNSAADVNGTATDSAPEASFGGQISGANRKLAIVVDYREACANTEDKATKHYTKMTLDYHLWATRAYAAEFGFTFKALACGANTTLDAWMASSLRKEFDCIMSVDPNVFLRHESQLLPKLIADGQVGEPNTNSSGPIGVAIGCRSKPNDLGYSLTDVSRWSLKAGGGDNNKIDSVATRFPTFPRCTPGSAKFVLAVNVVTRNCNPEFNAFSSFTNQSLPRGDTLSTMVDPVDAKIDGAQLMASMKPLANGWTDNRSPSKEPRAEEGTLPKRPRRFAILNVFSDPRRDLEKVSMWTTSQWNKQQYAAKHGYDYIMENADVVKPPYRTAHWAKMTAVLKYLHRYDWVWVADMDTIVTNASITLDSIVEAATKRNAGVEPGFLAVAEVNHVNSGSLMFRNTQRTYQFLRFLLVNVPVRHWKFFEQTSFTVALHRPEFSGGLVKELVDAPEEGKGLTKVFTALAASGPLPGAPGYTVLMEGRYLNAYPRGWPIPGYEWTPDSFIVHFPSFKDGIHTTLFSEFIDKSVEMNPGFTRLQEFR